MRILVYDIMERNSTYQTKIETNVKIGCVLVAKAKLQTIKQETKNR